MPEPSATVAVPAVMLNIVAVSPTGPGHLKAYSIAESEPAASTLNYQALEPGLNIANAIPVGVALDGSACPGPGCQANLLVMAAVSATHLVVDVVGYFRSDLQVVQTHLLVDFTPSLPATGATVDIVSMAVNLEGDDCCLLKGVDPPGRARLYDYQFEACDSSATGSSNVAILICPGPGDPCAFVANASTGIAETPGCTTISGPVDEVVDPETAKVYLQHSDTDSTQATTALAVRLYWQLLPP